MSSAASWPNASCASGSARTRACGPSPATSHIATGAPECTWCPICQLIAILRGDRPEISEKVAEAGASLVAALRAVLDAAAASPPRPPDDAASRVQHINLDDA